MRDLLGMLAVVSVVAGCAVYAATPEASKDDRVKRGEYLANVAGCSDCHTPGFFAGASDATRAFSGSEFGWQGPWGITYPRNLTPDPTGLAKWSEADIARAIRTGVRPDGSMLRPPMPWQTYAKLTDEDAAAIAAYLKSLPPIQHTPPAALPPGQSAPAGAAIIVIPSPPAWDAPKGAADGR